MSDPRTTYRTHEEVPQCMQRTQDPVRNLQKIIEEWGAATKQELNLEVILSLPCLFNLDLSLMAYYFSFFIAI